MMTTGITPVTQGPGAVEESKATALHSGSRGHSVTTPVTQSFLKQTTKDQQVREQIQGHEKEELRKHTWKKQLRGTKIKGNKTFFTTPMTAVEHLPSKPQIWSSAKAWLRSGGAREGTSTVKIPEETPQ